MVEPARYQPAQAALGIAVLVLATAFFAVLDTSVKYVGAFVPVLMAVWLYKLAIRSGKFEVIRGSLPFFAILLLMSVLLIMFPPITLFLRDLAFR